MDSEVRACRFCGHHAAGEVVLVPRWTASGDRRDLVHRPECQNIPNCIARQKAQQPQGVKTS